jgi:ubiquinone/menaquinone biosynthesis C-methylase UbiE
VLDYDREAACYDATRGGDARADAAADAIERLLPRAATSIADVACGTGIVTVRLVRPGRSVIGVDRSAGMAGVAAGRLPGRIALGDVTRLPLADGSVDAVTMVWLLHLLDGTGSAAAVAEAARVLRPGGTLITTVNKNGTARAGQTDDLERVVEIGGRFGLGLAGRTTFVGFGQGQSPRLDPVYQLIALRYGR